MKNLAQCDLWFSSFSILHTHTHTKLKIYTKEFFFEHYYTMILLQSVEMLKLTIGSMPPDSKYSIRRHTLIEYLQIQSEYAHQFARQVLAPWG